MISRSDRAVNIGHDALKLANLDRAALNRHLQAPERRSLLLVHRPALQHGQLLPSRRLQPLQAPTVIPQQRTRRTSQCQKERG